MNETIGKYLFVTLLIFGPSCGKGPKKYDNVVVERTRPVVQKFKNRSYAFGEFEMTGPISIKDFRAKLVLIGGNEAKMIGVRVNEEFLEDSTFFPIVHQGFNQVRIIGNDLQTDLVPEWEITLPDSFEMRIETQEGEIIAKNLFGILTIKSQLGDVSMKDCAGVFEINTQEGNILSENTGFLGRSRMASYMGDISVSLGESMEYEAAISSGNGEVKFAPEGHSISGIVKIISKNGLGSLSSFREPDSLGLFTSSGLEIEYEFKSFFFGAKSPEITLSSGTGKVKFLKSLTE
jgi:Toastrack DUF4097